MGATLSKLWASIRSAFSDGGGAGKSNHHANGHANSAAVKDVESGTHSPARTTDNTDVKMTEVKKYEITEVCSIYF